MQLTFILIHSPLTGPEVWLPVAHVLRSLGHPVVVPNLADSAAIPKATWEQHVDSVVTEVSAALAGSAEPLSRVVLVAHSGAGQIMGAVGTRMAPPPKSYLFVDAGLPPEAPATRLGLIRNEGGTWVDDFVKFLSSGGTFPNWTDAELRDELTDPSARQMVLDTLRPRGLSYFEEILEHTADLQSLRGGYLRFTPTYFTHERRAIELGWPVSHIPAGHFHLLVNPEQVADELVALTAKTIELST